VDLRSFWDVHGVGKWLLTTPMSGMLTIKNRDCQWSVVLRKSAVELLVQAIAVRKDIAVAFTH
jgi:hypothetical protein